MDTRKTIAVDARMINHSGVGTYLRNILRMLVESGAFRFTMMGDEAALRAYPWFAKADFIPLAAPIYSPKEQVELALKIPACDLFWTPHFNVPALPIRARKRLAYIHDVYHLDYPLAFGWAARKYARFLFQRAMRASDRVFTCSRFTQSRIQRHLGDPEHKVRVIPHGMEEGFAAGFERRPIGDEYVLFVGNLKPNKNLGRLLRAFDAIAGEFPGLKLYLVGRMEGLASPDAEIHKLVAAMAPGRVSLKGQVSFSDLKNYYANARLYALPSIYEGFGFPLLEAMAFGIPIVCSNAASLPEVGGEAVPYFDPLDTAAIADAMRTALRERPSGLAGKYRPHLETFTWEKAGRAHMDLIMDMFRPAAGRAAA